ncbi:MAG: glycosyltransferase family 2 protein, partial [Anaerolineae bacterium]
PFVTVIMPIRNEAAYIARSLGAVLAQDYPHDRMEVLVVDGMSDDGTRDVVAGLQVRHPQFAIRILNNPARIVPTALNLGLRHARGEIIIRVDGHCEIAPDYVHRCVEALRETGADCVGGICATTVGETLTARTVALAQSAWFGVGGVAFRVGRGTPGCVDTVPFGAYRREVFARIGGFDEELVRNQDDEFNFRLTQAGGKIWLDPSIRSIYHSRACLRGLWRQYFQYGLYKVRVIQKRRGIPSWRHLVPAVFVLGLVGSLFLALVTRQPLWALGVAGPYAVANVAASLWTARHDPQALPFLPLAFATLHLAYGLGFLWGLWRWRAYHKELMVRHRSAQGDFYA